MRPAYVSTCHFATQDSLLRTTTRTSSTCTGAYTSEMSLAVIQKTINESKALSFNVCFRPVSAHETWSVNWSFFSKCQIDIFLIENQEHYVLFPTQHCTCLLTTLWIDCKSFICFLYESTLKNTVFELGIPLDSSSLYLIGQKKINYMRLAWLWFG